MTSKEVKTHIIDTINGDMNKEYFINEILPEILKDLELLEALKQRWQQEDWCEGIELSVESLNSLFKYNKDLFDKNLELDKKLEAEFEDSADEICKIATERDKLYDEKFELIGIINVFKDYVKYFTFGAELDFESFILKNCTEKGQKLFRDLEVLYDGK